MDELLCIVKDLLGAMKQLGKTVEGLAVKVEQQTSLRDSMLRELSAVNSELAELHHRVEKLSTKQTV